MSLSKFSKCEFQSHFAKGKRKLPKCELNVYDAYYEISNLAKD